ncbi:MAG: GTP cyclohydrolase I FolE [Spirochaetia bacterium]|nr:GTP cyclohydrolase I FolE [Spirochaetia bacterium]
MSNTFNLENAKEAALKLIESIGEDKKREGLLKTPDRVAKAYEFMTSGYRQNLDDLINEAIYNESNKGMIIVNNIEFFSLCEHHMLPFYGHAHVGYIPDGKIIGISKIPRIVDMFARRLQVQERLTEEIAETIKKAINPLGVAVVLEAEHMCMMMRGVEKQASSLTTSSMRGVFQKSQSTRMEFLSLIHPKKG